MLFSEIRDKVKIHGRGAITAEGLEADWSAAGFELRLRCETRSNLTIHYRVEPTKPGRKFDYFRAFYDGEAEPERTPLLMGENNMTFYIGEGEHTFMLLKCTFAAFTNVTFTAVEFDGEILGAPAPKDLLIEYVGVSYTGGSSCLGTAKDKVSPRYHDGTLAYACQSALALDADFSVIAVGGSGVVYSYSDTLIPQTYDWRSYFRDRTVPYDFKRTADMVIMDIGANDRGLGATPEQFYTNAYTFCSHILEKNPGAKMIFLHFPRFRDTLKKLVAQLNADGHTTYYLERTWWELLGGGKHPNVAEHAMTAREITDFVKTIL